MCFSVYLYTSWNAAKELAVSQQHIECEEHDSQRQATKEAEERRIIAERQMPKRLWELKTAELQP